MAKKLGKCSSYKQPLTKPPHKAGGAVLCDHCYFGGTKHFPDGSYVDGTRPGGEAKLAALKGIISPGHCTIADEIWKEE